MRVFHEKVLLCFTILVVCAAAMAFLPASGVVRDYALAVTGGFSAASVFYLLVGSEKVKSN